MSTPRTSGASLLSLKHFVESEHGAGAFVQVVSALPQATRDEIGTVIVPMAWYDTRSVLAAIDVAREIFGNGQTGDFYERYGASAADYAINRFFKFMLKFTTPATAVQRGMKVWRNYHTTGEWEFQVGDHTFTGTLRNFGVVHGGYCRFLRGWLRTAGDLTGGKNSRLDHVRCRSTGADACVFVGAW